MLFRSVDVFLEYDTGSEPLTRVIAKLAGYAALAARTGITTPVLYCLRSPSREAALHARLADPPPPGIRDAASAAQIPGVPVATATPDSSPQGPAGAAWLPAGTPGPRFRLAQLAPPGITPADSGPDGEEPGGPPGGLPWHPPDPAPPAWTAAAGEPRPGQDDDAPPSRPRRAGRRAAGRHRAGLRRLLPAPAVSRAGDAE